MSRPYQTLKPSARSTHPRLSLAAGVGFQAVADPMRIDVGLALDRGEDEDAQEFSSLAGCRRRMGGCFDDRDLPRASASCPASSHHAALAAADLCGRPDDATGIGGLRCTVENDGGEDRRDQADTGSPARL